MRSWNPNYPPAPGLPWQQALTTVGRGTLLVAGGPGRSAVARWLLGQLDRSLPRVALVDAHLEVPTVGVPGCIGLALTGPWRAPARLEFVGSYRALDRPLNAASGVARLVRRAHRSGVQGVIVDAGPVPMDAQGLDFLDHLSRLAEVDEVVWVGTEDGGFRPGVPPDLGGPALLSGLPTHRLPADPDWPRPSVTRKQAYRDARLAAHFRGARLHRIGLGRLHDPKHESPRPEVGLMLGLTANDGACLALGRIEDLAPDHLALRTPLASLERIARAHLGEPRLDASAWADQEAVEALLGQNA